MRIAIAVAAALGLASLVVADPSHAAIKRHTHIPAQSLGPALKDFAESRDLQILYFTNIVRDLRTPGAVGEITTDEALNQILHGTGLTYKYLDDRTITILPEAEEAGSQSAPPLQVPTADDRVKQTQRASFWDRLRIAQAGSPPTQTTSAGATTDNDSHFQKLEVEEVIVTAQKRAERLQDVPVPVTAVNTALLVNTNQLRLQDYYTKIPGLNLTIGGNTATPQISIRGVTTGGAVANPTVAIVVDDIPFGPSTSGSGNGTVAADFDPNELARIEVLRGPQGTLYGASSLGGLLKYVTVDPSLDRVSGRLQMATSSVHQGDDFGYSLHSDLNVPLSETLAIRASATTRREPGYVDNIQTNQEDINRTDSQSARVAALWRPNELFSLKLSALYQHSERDGSPDIHLPSPAGPNTLSASGRPDLKDLQQFALRGTGTYEAKLQAYSATMTLTLPRAELVSLTGYSRRQIGQSTDRAISFGSFALANFGVSGAAQISDNDTPKFSQELRLTTALTDNIDWMFGAFYTHEKYPSHPEAVAIDPAAGERVGVLLHSDNGGSYNEYAAFTNLTFKLSDRFDIGIGGRASRNKFASGPIISLPGPLAPAGGLIPRFASEDDAFTYSLTPRLRVSDDLMLYARIASGYRPGGPNTSTAAIAAGLPAQYGPDTTWNYEVGIKGNAMDGMLSFDGSVYRIDWKDIQLQLQSPTNVLLGYTTNAGEAKSQGVELSLGIRNTWGSRVSAWGAYNDAKLTEVPTNSTLTARAGDRLSYGARWSGSVSVDQKFSVTQDMSGFMGASFSYVGDRKGRYFIGFPQETFPSYTQLDLSGGLAWHDWTLTAYLNNVADERGVLRSGRDSAFIQYGVTCIQPRTFGISLARDF